MQQFVWLITTIYNLMSPGITIYEQIVYQSIIYSRPDISLCSFSQLSSSAFLIASSSFSSDPCSLLRNKIQYSVSTDDYDIENNHCDRIPCSFSLTHTHTHFLSLSAYSSFSISSSASFCIFSIINKDFFNSLSLSVTSSSLSLSILSSSRFARSSA